MNKRIKLISLSLVSLLSLSGCRIGVYYLPGTIHDVDYRIEISFDTGGGEKIQPIKVNTDENVNPNDYVAKKDGYTFAYWTLDKEVGNPIREATHYSNNTTFYAMYYHDFNAPIFLMGEYPSDLVKNINIIHQLDKKGVSSLNELSPKQYTYQGKKYACLTLKDIGNKFYYYSPIKWKIEYSTVDEKIQTENAIKNLTEEQVWTYLENHHVSCKFVPMNFLDYSEMVLNDDDRGYYTSNVCGYLIDDFYNNCFTAEEKQHLSNNIELPLGKEASETPYVNKYKNNLYPYTSYASAKHSIFRGGDIDKLNQKANAWMIKPHLGGLDRVNNYTGQMFDEEGIVEEQGFTLDEGGYIYPIIYPKHASEDKLLTVFFDDPDIDVVPTSKRADQGEVNNRYAEIQIDSTKRIEKNSKIVAGWKDESTGVTYAIGDTIKISKNTILTSVFEEPIVPSDNSYILELAKQGIVPNEGIGPFKLGELIDGHLALLYKNGVSYKKEYGQNAVSVYGGTGTMTFYGYEVSMTYDQTIKLPGDEVEKRYHLILTLVYQGDALAVVKLSTDLNVAEGYVGGVNDYAQLGMDYHDALPLDGSLQKSKKSATYFGNGYYFTYEPTDYSGHQYLIDSVITTSIVLW